MVLWLIILAGAFGGGLVVLHGFSKWKAGGEQMLETYQQMLNHAAEQRRRREGAKTGNPKSDGRIEAVLPDDDKQAGI